MNIKTIFFSSILVLTLFSSANAAKSISSLPTSTDCSWVGTTVKDCVVFEGLGDLVKVFKGPGRYAVRYLNTASWTTFNLYRATSYAIGSTSITVTDVNGIDMTNLLQIYYDTHRTITGLPVGQVSSDITLIYDVKGNSSAADVEFKNVCTWSGWC